MSPERLGELERRPSPDETLLRFANASVPHAISTRATGTVVGRANGHADLGPGRRILARHLGREPGALVQPGLVHGSEVREVDSRHRADRVGTGFVTADAVWTRDPELWLLVSAADCFAVLFAHEEAVGVAHAGWRGVALGVASGLLTAMASALACPPTAFEAYLAPGISTAGFEVGPEVRAEFDERGFVDFVHAGRGDRSHVDLHGVLQESLRRVEGPDLRASGLASEERLDLFWSHRREGAAAGRFGLAACLGR